MFSSEQLTTDAVSLLKSMIARPSFSREEEKTAALIAGFLEARGVPVFREGNNVWTYNARFDNKKPTILLNSHHDTVKPNPGYTRDPFAPAVEGGKLYGLGSNDAGGPLVALISVFLFFYPKENLAYNLCLAATAEEEISGKNGIELILPKLGKLDFAIVGEPTQMQLAVAEKGLMVLDCTSHGQAGHAARDEGENAIYKAMKDVEWFRTYRFPKESKLLGPVKLSVTVISAGTQHNVVPASCTFTVDVRTTDAYTNQEALDIIQRHVSCDVVARSTRLNPSSIDSDHPVVKAGRLLGMTTFGSPTLSDQALLNIPSLKLGPGDSARSHSADEFIFVEEIGHGITNYIQLLSSVIYTNQV
jgi:acetylornithine deacetylase